MSGIVVVAIISSVSLLLGFLAFLGLCAFIVVRTGKTAGLRDLAVAVSSFRGALDRWTTKP